MEVTKFIELYRQGFGDQVELPTVFWYSDSPLSEPQKIGGCFMKAMSVVRKGGVLTFDAEAVQCPGGKLYTGFGDVPPFVREFVSHKECYKESPELVDEFIEKLQIERAEKKYLNFSSLAQVKNWDEIIGVLFFATPDMLSGLVTWIQFDNNWEDSVSVPFGSGCSSTISQVVKENREGGHRTFLGLFDPSVRPTVEPNILCLGVPMSRMNVLFSTMERSCIKGVHAWNRVKERIENA